MDLYKLAGKVLRWAGFIAAAAVICFVLLVVGDKALRPIVAQGADVVHDIWCDLSFTTCDSEESDSQPSSGNTTTGNATDTDDEDADTDSDAGNATTGNATSGNSSSGTDDADKFGSAGAPPKSVLDVATQLGVSSGAQISAWMIPNDPDTIGGWIIAGEGVTIAHIPAGVCVNYDPTATKVTGKVDKAMDSGKQSRLVRLAEVGSSKPTPQSNGNQQLTLYWTPC